MLGYFESKFSLANKPRTTFLFLAEGKAEVGFLENYLTQAGADREITTVLCFEGVDKMAQRADTLAKLLDKEEGGIDRIKAIGLLADSEDNPQGRVDSIINCAKAFGFPKAAKELLAEQSHEDGGRRFAFALSPNAKTNGRIETLILQEIEGSAVFKCIEKEFACIAAARGKPVDQKAKVQMYISAMANSSMAGIQHAFNAGFFDVGAAPYSSARQMVDKILAT